MMSNGGREPKLAPLADKNVGLPRVDVEVNGPDFVWNQDAGVLHGTRSGRIKAVDENHHAVLLEGLHLRQRQHILTEFHIFRRVKARFRPTRP